MFLFQNEYGYVSSRQEHRVGVKVEFKLSQLKPPCYKCWPSMQTCKSLLRHNSVKILNNLAKYVYYAFKNRIAFQ